MSEVLMDAFHDLNLKEKLLSFLEDEALCDVTIVTVGKEMRAHRVILAANSIYFRTLFKTNVGSEENKNVLQFLEYESSEMDDIINYMYTGKICVTWSNVFELMQLEELLLVWNLRPLLSSFLIDNIDLHHCWEVKAKADFYNYHDVSEAAFLFIRENFKTVIRESQFLEGASFHLLEECLKSPILNVPTEGFLLCRLVEWVMWDTGSRERYLEGLLSRIDPRQIVSWSECIKFLQRYLSVNCVAGTLEEWLESAQEVRSSHTGSLNRRYKELIKDGVFAVGGRGLSDEMVSSIEVSVNVSTMPWRLLLPTTNCISAAPHSMDVPLPTLPQPRFTHASAASYFSFYVIGGQTSEWDQTTRTDRYDVFTNCWTSCPDLPLPLSSAAGAFLDGAVFVSGGFSKHPNQPHNHLLVLREKSTKWVELSPMRHARHSHSLVAARGALYAIGGLGNQERLRSVERYDPLSDSWLEVAPLLCERHSFCAVALRASIYVIKGELGHTSHRDTFNERYDCDSNTWSKWRLNDVGKPCYGGLFGRSVVVVSGRSGHSVHVYSTVSEVVHEATPSLNQARLQGSLIPLKIPVHKKLPI